jgi:hypothetical protein
MFPYVPPQFIGLSTATLQQNLATAQAAYAQLTAGSKVVRAAYNQGDGGSKEITYYLTDQTLANLQQYMASLAQQLAGPGPGNRYRRRPARPLYL